MHYLVSTPPFLPVVDRPPIPEYVLIFRVTPIVLIEPMELIFSLFSDLSLSRSCCSNMASPNPRMDWLNRASPTAWMTVRRLATAAEGGGERERGAGL